MGNGTVYLSVYEHRLLVQQRYLQMFAFEILLFVAFAHIVDMELVQE